ncbi:MAG: Radical SAM domain-containing protein [Thermoanaerobacterales bacterium 50_218]|nr:MAG: Radical SAM domain-containing protein [Thermoanaerobacterales bacterium 50_218]HAA89197.1 thioether cross-link-forming SCIFF peptide maturase [Peptococcaceae bacterium]
MHSWESRLFGLSKIDYDFSAHLHLFSVDGLFLAFDVNSGSLHLLDQVAWFFLQTLLSTSSWNEAYRRTSYKFGERVASEATGELQHLGEEGLLFTDDRLLKEYVPSEELGLKALCLNVAHCCNMACRYCFVPSQVRAENDLMSPEVVKAAIDFLLRETPYNYLSIDFFGGEPLLNFEAIELAVNYALEEGSKRGKKWKFTLTTNTLLLNERVFSLAKKHNFCMVLSCDGRPEVHDYYRVTPNGKGTQARVVRKIREFLDHWCVDEYYVRGTYTRRNLDFCKDVLYLADIGAESISVEPVASEPGPEYALRREDLPVIRKEYFRLARLLREREKQGKKIAFYHYCIDPQGGPCVAKRLTGCGAGYQYLAVTPEGEIYPCHQFVGHSEWKMGDVWQGITSPEIREKFLNAHVYQKEPCKKCWARFLCGGGCHAQAALIEGDLLRPHPISCEIVKNRLEAALYYIALGHQAESEEETLVGKSS